MSKTLTGNNSNWIRNIHFMHKENQQGLLAILGANIIFGLNIPVTKALVAQWMTPIGYTTIRMFFGTLVFWAASLLMRSEKVHRNDLVLMFIGGLMGFLGTQFLFSLSLEYTSPVVFSLIMALTPAVVLLLSAMILREAIPARKITGIILGISGAALIILLGKSNSENGAHGALGILFAFLCVLCYSGYLVLTRRISVKYQPVTVAKWMFLVSAVAVFPFSTTVLNEQAMFTESTALLPYVLLAFALLFSTTLAFFLMPFALKRLEASVVSIFMNLQPIIASVVAMVVGQDSLTWDKPLAAILVLAGVYFVSTERLSKRKPVVLNA